MQYFVVMRLASGGHDGAAFCARDLSQGRAEMSERQFRQMQGMGVCPLGHYPLGLWPLFVLMSPCCHNIYAN